MALTDNIVSYYKFDSSNSNDSAGSNNGTDTSITYSSGNGKINIGAGFGGASKISIGTGFYPTAAGITVTGWIKVSNYNQYQMIMAKRTAGTAEVFEFYVQLTSGKLSFYNGTAEFPGSAAIGTGSFVFVCMTLSNSTSGTLKFYINGSLDSTQTGVSIGGGSSTTNTCLGTYNNATGGGVEWLIGSLDEVGYWDRPLSASEITQLYNSGDGLQYPFSTVNNSAGAAAFF